MSRAELLALLEDMERALDTQEDGPDPEFITAWDRAFMAAAQAAERGPDWPDLVARAQRLGRRMEARAVYLQGQMERMRAELNLQGQGDRALKGYRTTP